MLWQFDFGREPPRAENFEPFVVSDGLLRAAATALLTSMRTPPSLILIEEFENDISQKNLGHFLTWLRQASGPHNSSERGYKTQFILTSHSPSVLREFSDYLSDVFYIWLKKRKYTSAVRNLKESLVSFVDLGTIEAEEDYEKDGKRIVKVSPEVLLELWYQGVIGGGPE